MNKFIKLSLVLAVLILFGSLTADLAALENHLIRLHVVGASDSAADQQVKLQVKDAIAAYLQQELSGVENAAQARAELEKRLTDVERLANRVLAEAGLEDTVTVTLEREEFSRRDYETFSLPAGVYESLRIRIGAAEGKNWWCVVFPNLCLSATTQELQTAAAGAGFSDTLTDTLTREDYEIRFWLLDCLGELQNFFHAE